MATSQPDSSTSESAHSASAQNTIARIAAQSPARQLGQMRAGLLHHLQQGDAEDFGREAVDLGHLGGADGRDGVERDGGRMLGGRGGRAGRGSHGRNLAPGR